MDALLLSLGLGATIGLLVLTSRRWGPPHLFVPVTVALWLVVAILAVLALGLRVG